jgi:hypothetical protein
VSSKVRAGSPDAIASASVTTAVDRAAKRAPSTRLLSAYAERKLKLRLRCSSSSPARTAKSVKIGWSGNSSASGTASMPDDSPLVVEDGNADITFEAAVALE